MQSKSSSAFTPHIPTPSWKTTYPVMPNFAINQLANGLLVLVSGLIIMVVWSASLWEARAAKA